MKLENEILYVEMVEHGAELTRIYNKKTGAEILWNADPKFWKRHSPVLFPNVGKTWHNVVKIQGEQYPGNELKVSRQTISKWESCQSYPDFQRLVLLSDFFGLTLDELVRDIDVQEVREKNLNNEKLSSIYDDINEGKKFIRLCYIIGTGVLIFFSLIVLYGVFFSK